MSSGEFNKHNDICHIGTKCFVRYHRACSFTDCSINTPNVWSSMKLDSRRVLARRRFLNIKLTSSDQDRSGVQLHRLFYDEYYEAPWRWTPCGAISSGPSWTWLLSYLRLLEESSFFVSPLSPSLDQSRDALVVWKHYSWLSRWWCQSLNIQNNIFTFPIGFP